MSDDHRRFSLFDDQHPDPASTGGGAGTGNAADSGAGPDAPTEWVDPAPRAPGASDTQPPGPPLPLPATPDEASPVRPLRPAPWPASWEEPLPPPPPPGTAHPSSGASQRGAYPPGVVPLPGAGRRPTDATRPGAAYPPGSGYPPGSAYPPDEPGYPPGAAAYPPPPPPPYDPYAPRPVARGVTFKRQQEEERRGFALPLAGIVLVVLGAAIGLWLLGIVGGPDRSSRSATPKPTLGGVIGSLSPSASGSASPSASLSESPTESPSFSEEPTPSESPTESPTPSPTESITPSPAPTDTPPAPTPPPTAPPDIPTPQPTEPPPGFPAGPGEVVLKVDYGDADFTGGHEGTYHGRSARWVTGQATSGHTMTVRFWVTGDPRRTARLRINGLDSEEAGKVSIRIRINGVAIFTGPDPLANDVCCGGGGEGRWTSVAFDFDSNLLQPGENRLTIQNLESGGTAAGPFLMLDDARLLYRIRP